MTTEVVKLRQFSDSELIFDEQETKAILSFFFPGDRQQIEVTEITNETRAFAQALLVEAVDATYAMGWVEQTFRWVANPGSGLKKALHKLARRASQYWFKHLKNQPLDDVKIYESVRNQLARSFRSPFQIILQAKLDRPRRSFAAHVNYEAVTDDNRLWG